MSNSQTISPAPSSAMPAALQQKALRKLFLTLFLRGRSSRGLKKQTVPKSVAQKLWLTLLAYAAFGLFTLGFMGQPVFALSIYLHAMTFVFLGLFIGSSAGEILFNKDEADILLHRPINPGALLWAKIRVLVEVSLWLAFALNLVGFGVGFFAAKNRWLYPIAHLISITLQAVFCTGCVVMVYQLCLRWSGRERLDGLMTTAQIVVSVAMVLAGQILPQVMFRGHRFHSFDAKSWWIALLPPAWFAGFDDALAGSGTKVSWILAAAALVITALVAWIAFGKLAQDYESGLQKLNEGFSSSTRKRTARRWIDRLTDLPPIRWWLRDPVSRASFMLTAAYLTRDREMKLRLYPSIAPILVLPFIIFLHQNGHQHDTSVGGFSVAFAGAYAGLVPLLAINLLQYSQQWQASDIFRAAPMRGPASLCNGARRAVLCILALPPLAMFGLIVYMAHHQGSELLLLIPGIILLPIYTLIPSLRGEAVPLSRPSEEAKSASRGLEVMAVVVVSVVISLLASLALSVGLFWWFVLGETIIAGGVYAIFRRWLENSVWSPLE
jgi:ABC-2 type transport system permease protein